MIKKPVLNILFIAGFFVLLSCRRDADVLNIKNLNGNKIYDLGHGGMGNTFKYPMDSYESIEACLYSGAKGTELDIQITKDSVLVVFHNNMLNDFASCNGKINEQNWSDIDGCKFSSPASSQIYIMSFDGILNRLDKPENYYYSLDIKLDSAQEDKQQYYSKFANAIFNTAKKHNILDKIFVESYDVNFLKLVKQKSNLISCFSAINKPVLNQSIDAKNNGMDGVITHQQNTTRIEVDSIHKLGLKVMLWGCYFDSENALTVEKSPDIIQSDKITHLTKYLKGIN